MLKRKSKNTNGFLTLKKQSNKLNFKKKKSTWTNEPSKSGLFDNRLE